MQKSPSFGFSDADATHLWVQFRTGDVMAFGVLMKEFYRPLFNYGRRFTTDRNTLHDTIQDLFLHLWEARLNVSPTEHVRFYLLKSLKNRLVSAHVKSARTLPIEDANLESLTWSEGSVEGLLIDQENASTSLPPVCDWWFEVTQVSNLLNKLFYFNASRVRRYPTRALVS
jgi:DNA-directed RNA polymerase specialized sigma24 family protein